ncbi:hypothetical protein JHK85_000001 [Glycine max]|nr:hypothetical protein JHK85_000001 [Glycine max]
MCVAQHEQMDCMVEIESSINANANFHRIALEAPPTSTFVTDSCKEFYREGFILSLVLEEGSVGYGEHLHLGSAVQLRFQDQSPADHLTTKLKDVPTKNQALTNWYDVWTKAKKVYSNDVHRAYGAAHLFCISVFFVGVSLCDRATMGVDHPSQVDGGVAASAHRHCRGESRMDAALDAMEPYDFPNRLERN